MKILKNILNWFVFLMTGKDDQCVNDGTHDFSGQGRDKYGR